MSGRGIALALCTALAALSPFFGIPGWTVSLATVAALTALGLIGLNLIFGVVGMLAFGQAAFMALPGYIGGVLEKLGLPLLLALAVGFVATLVIARAMAQLFVRLPGVFLAIGTLAFGFVVEGLARAFPAWTGGASGLIFAFGRQLDPLLWYVGALAALVLGLAIYASLVRGATWRRLRTIRHDELAAAVLGIDVAREKARAYAIGSGFAAAAGILLTGYVGVLIPENAGVTRSLEQVGTVLLGGLGTLAGPVVGSVIVQWLFVVSAYGQKYELLIYGVAFLGAVLYAPQGIVGLVARLPLLRAAGKPMATIALPTTRAASPAEAAAMPDGLSLVVADASKHYGGVVAVDGISFEVRHGEVFTIVGPNGAGKTTLFNLISGVERPTSGRIAVEGRNLADVSIDRRAPLMGRSFQVARLVPELTALENVMVRLDQIAPASSEDERAAVALAQLTMFDLQHLAFRPVRELSLGQHKLIDLARAAVGDPPLVLLDEPAVGLTRGELDHLAELLARLKRRGSAVVIVEHNIDFVASVATRGIVLDSGRAIAYGRVDNILADPRVREAYFGVLT
jgi:ABC-type branched-subunit amino acid transport system ATPase component/ABC-type branched-subunit amino acid transport system permease subunit